MPPNSDSEQISSVIPVLFGSVLFHIILFGIVPLASKMLRKNEVFIRPQTFQLVRAPFMPVEEPLPVIKPKRNIASKKSVDRKKVKKNKPTPKSKAEPTPIEEDLSELQELLSELPQPVSEINIGKKFPYQWYLNSVMSKVERSWKPAVHNDKLSVMVRFTIFPTGKISDVSIYRSSGSITLDNMAVRAVALAAPFGKLPSSFKGKLDISYTLYSCMR